MDEPEFDPLTREFIYSNGQRITQEAYHRLVAATPRPTSRAASVRFHNSGRHIHVWDVLSNPNLVNGMVLRFIIEKQTHRTSSPYIKQLHYAALYAGDKWYLTGAGEWYGTNVLTKEQMLEVLQRTECVSVQVSEQWENLDHKPPF